MISSPAQSLSSIRLARMLSISVVSNTSTVLAASPKPPVLLGKTPIGWGGTGFHRQGQGGGCCGDHLGIRISVRRQGDRHRLPHPAKSAEDVQGPYQGSLTQSQTDQAGGQHLLCRHRRSGGRYAPLWRQGQATPKADPVSSPKRQLLTITQEDGKEAEAILINALLKCSVQLTCSSSQQMFRLSAVH